MSPLDKSRPTVKQIQPVCANVSAHGQMTTLPTTSRFSSILKPFTVSASGRDACRRGRVLPSRGTVGLQTTSAHSARSLRQADHQGFDAAFVSAVFPSRSPSAGTPLGLARYRSLVKTVSIPCYGLGGINSSNALAIARLGGFACVEGLAG